MDEAMETSRHRAAAAGPIWFEPFESLMRRKRFAHTLPRGASR